MPDTTTDERALLAAIANDPPDDTVRLAYADFLDETGEPERMDHAALIRVQCELVRSPGNWNEARQEIKNRKLLGQFSNDQAAILLAVTDTYPSPQHLRERELLNDHPEWQQVTCPACKGKKGHTNPTGGFKEFSGSYPRWESCKFCSGTGHLPLTLRRGFPHRVTVPKLEQVGKEQRFCRVCRESRGEWNEIDRHCYCARCDSNHPLVADTAIRRFNPTDHTRDLLAALPTVQELVPGNKRPESGWLSYGELTVEGSQCVWYRYGLPQLIWESLKGYDAADKFWKRYPTDSDAISALGVTIAQIVREK